jgi:hypothetical protein
VSIFPNFPGLGFEDAVAGEEEVHASEAFGKCDFDLDAEELFGVMKGLLALEDGPAQASFDHRRQALHARHASCAQGSKLGGHFDATGLQPSAGGLDRACQPS